MSTATNGAYLLRAVLDEPGEDAHRLVYADWLDDDGQADRAEFIRVQVELANRAEFIRVQVELANVPDGPGVCPRDQERCLCRSLHYPTCPLRRRARTLLLAGAAPPHGTPAWRVWAGPALGVIPEGAPFDDHLTFRRGFVERVVCTLDAWREHGPAIVRAHPVTRAEVTGKEPRRREKADDLGRWTREACFGWERPDLDYSGMAPDVLPRAIWYALRDSTYHRGHFKGYPTPEAALDALCGAALAWAKLPEGKR